MILLCPCQSQKNYADCCEPFITNKQVAPTPETLMRSRYTAFTQANTDYIEATMADKALIGFDKMEAQKWAKKVIWIGLQVLHSDSDHVEFEATYIEKDRLKKIHEHSKFLFKNNRWYYIDGSHLPPSQAEHTLTRNSKCPCGSAKKYKNCHGQANL